MRISCSVMSCGVPSVVTVENQSGELTVPLFVVADAFKSLADNEPAIKAILTHLRHRIERAEAPLRDSDSVALLKRLEQAERVALKLSLDDLAPLARDAGQSIELVGPEDRFPAAPTPMGCSPPASDPLVGRRRPTDEGNCA